jgi:hypothetical protein
MLLPSSPNCDVLFFLSLSVVFPSLQPVRLAGGCRLVLVCSKRKVLLAGCWWLICSERKIVLTGG